MEFRNALILAPMVRVGTLPMRIIALRYGADIVYSPEIIDKRLMTSTRVVNKTLGTIDFIDAKQTICLRVHPSEKERLVIQIGSACPILALRAAKLVENDCFAIDLNCGCPKPFSTLGNMGAALLSNPDLLVSILTALKTETSLVVTCKIRNLETTQATIDLMRKIEAVGVSAIAVHFRTRGMKSTEAALWDRVEEVCRGVDVPVIVNGDVFGGKDIRTLSERAGGVGYMIARAAQSNPYVFKGLKIEMDRMRRTRYDCEKENVKDEVACEKKLTDVMREYTSLCMEYDMPIQNAKFVLCQFAPPRASKLHREVCDELGVDYYHGSVAKSKCYEDLAVLLGLEAYYEEVLEARKGVAKGDTGDYTSEYLYTPDGVVLPVYDRADKRKADVLV